eukprot:SAG22_NODE_727_length_7598_cov_89.922523_3_plen_97_part_00
MVSLGGGGGGGADERRQDRVAVEQVPAPGTTLSFEQNPQGKAEKDEEGQWGAGKTRVASYRRTCRWPQRVADSAWQPAEPAAAWATSVQQAAVNKQ